METLFQDLRYGARMLLKKPGFTLIAIVTLGLGIGASTAVFSVVNAFLLHNLPYKDPERLVVIQHSQAAADYRSVDSYPVLSDLREQAQSFDDAAAFSWRRLTLDGADGPETVFGSSVTSNFFSVLGVAPIMGRDFLPGEDEPNKPALVILSYGLWQRQFGADSNIIGQTITADKERVEIIGVMAPDFTSDLLPEIPKVEFWMPLGASRRMMASRNISWLRIIARLKPATTLAETRSELEVIAERIRNQPSDAAPRKADDFSLNAVAVKQFFVGDSQKPLLVLLGAVGFVLLISCVNVANLVLAQGVGRQKEIAIRAVLGASRRRLLSQMLTESLMLSLAGGIVGLFFVVWSLQGIIWLTPKGMLRMQEVRLDQRVFFFTLAASLFTGILFGLLPSLQASKVNLQSSLKTGTSTTGATRRGFRSLLVTAEVALAVVLLIGAGLMIKSFIRLTGVDVGFNTENMLSMEIKMLSRLKEPEQSAFAREALERITGLPGVTEAAFIDSLPTDGGNSQSNKRSRMLEGPVAVDPDGQLTIEPRFATKDYFQTMGIRLVKGRLFTGADTPDAQPVVIVSRQLAEQAWPGEDPVGKRFLWNWKEGQKPTVIGVVTDVRLYDREAAPVLYAPFDQSPSAGSYLVIRASADPSNLTAAIRNQIFEIDRRVVVDNVMAIKQRLGNSVAQPRFYTVLLGLFGAMGMLLSVLGLYGVISYSVSQQTHEIGIRIALGAQRRDIFKLVIGHGFVLAIIGLALGLAGAFALSRLLTSLLFGVTPTDAATYTAVSLLILATALVACFVPARRATRVDPMVALRYE
ncbi:MAG: ABC transporter permease [Blastocatellia bacterium]